MRRLLWLLALPLAAFAQLDDNTVTVSASRQLPALQPDQAVFGVYVNAPSNATLDDVLAALPGAGLSAANLSGAQTGSLTGSTPSTLWTFTVTVPLSKLGATLATLTRVASASTLQVSSYLMYTQVSPELQATQQCAYTALVNDAQAAAQKLAAAAGARLGPVLSLSDNPSGATAIFAEISGSFSFTQTPANRIQSVLSSPQPYFSPNSCAMTVQFGLLP